MWGNHHLHITGGQREVREAPGAVTISEAGFSQTPRAQGLSDSLQEPWEGAALIWQGRTLKLREVVSSPRPTATAAGPGGLFQL